MNRFKRRSLLLFIPVFVVVLMAAVSIPWLYSGNSSPDVSRPGPGIALAAPLLQTAAFPSDEAGFGAYLNVGAAIDDVDDLGAVGTVCTTVPAFSQTHMLCEVDDNNLALVNIHLYADTNGLVVAFLPDNQPISRAAVWSGDESLPGTTFQPIFESPTLALDDIVRRAVETVGVDYPAQAANTGYFDWEFPAASTLTIMTKTVNTEAVQTYNFARPNDPLFEVSVTGYGDNRVNSVLLDGTNILNTQNVYRGARRNDADVATNRVGPDVLHRVDNQPRIGSAIYLLWTPQP